MIFMGIVMQKMHKFTFTTGLIVGSLLVAHVVQANDNKVHDTAQMFVNVKNIANNNQTSGNEPPRTINQIQDRLIRFNVARIFSDNEVRSITKFIDPNDVFRLSSELGPKWTAENVNDNDDDLNEVKRNKQVIEQIHLLNSAADNLRNYSDEFEGKTKLDVLVTVGELADTDPFRLESMPNRGISLETFTDYLHQIDEVVKMAEEAMTNTSGQFINDGYKVKAERRLDLYRDVVKQFNDKVKGEGADAIVAQAKKVIERNEKNLASITDKQLENATEKQLKDIERLKAEIEKNKQVISETNPESYRVNAPQQGAADQTPTYNPKSFIEDWFAPSQATISYAADKTDDPDTEQDPENDRNEHSTSSSEGASND